MTDDRELGVYEKYHVRRTDGRDAPGEKHADCCYFVLDLNHDKHAIPALKAYADACALEYPLLAIHLRLALGNIQARGAPWSELYTRDKAATLLDAFKEPQ